MRLARFITLSFVFVSFLPFQAVAFPSSFANSFADIAAAQAGAVVNISTTKVIRGRQGLPPGFGFPQGSPFNQFFHDFMRNMPSHEQHALGTGFVISQDGYIVTNNHVVDGADEIIVKMKNGKEYPAKLIGTDKKVDVALLKVKARGLQTVKLGDSKALRVGDWVMAIGNPFGLSQTVTAGIVSAKGRVIGAGPYDHFIQTDAAINPGNSGGPLFNLKGEVIGINTAIYSRSGGSLGIGFAIPINMAKPIIVELRKTGHVTRARLGVYIEGVDKATMQALGLKNKHGALVRQVEDGSAADKAGIKPGDVIVSVDGNLIKNMHDLPILISRLKPGHKARIGLIRDGKAINIVAKVEKMPETASGTSNAGKQQARLGLLLRNLDADLAENLQTGVKKGVVVQQVQPGSAAAYAGIKRGDVIFQVNRHAVNNLDQFNRMAHNFKPGDVLQLLLDRHGNTLFVIIRLPRQPHG